jgi:Domain of unknown function (DUF4386)
MEVNSLHAERHVTPAGALPHTAAIANVSAKHRWAGLYRGGAISALLIVALLLGEVAVYAAWPRPESAEQHLHLFGRDWLVGLLTLDLLGMLAYILFLPVMLALYLALRHLAEGTMLVATALFFMGVTIFFATNTALPVLALSAQYQAADTEPERLAVVGAAEAMFALFNETAFLTSYVMISASWVAVGAVMLHSATFGRVACYAGILAGLAGVVAVALEHVSAGMVAVAIPIYFAAMVLLIAWMVAIARGLRLMDRAAADPSVTDTAAPALE